MTAHVISRHIIFRAIFATISHLLLFAFKLNLEITRDMPTHFCNTKKKALSLGVQTVCAAFSAGGRTMSVSVEDPSCSNVKKTDSISLRRAKEQPGGSYQKLVEWLLEVCPPGVFGLLY